jgi:hypothetical protein
LAVVAIIGALIALLLPALKKARRHAAVAASPVAYLGTDSRIHLTDSTGGLDTPLHAMAQDTRCPLCHTPPLWNPSGTRIAFRFGDQKGYYTGMIDPYSGETSRHPETGRPFAGWLSSERFAETRGKGDMIHVRDAGTGQVLSAAPNPAFADFVSAAPPQAPAAFAAVGFHQGRRRRVIQLLGKDMAPGKVIWVPEDGMIVETPRFDPFGEYLAWTGGTMSRRFIQLKHVKDPAVMPPTNVGEAMKSVYFCDWTEQGTLLGNATDNGVDWGLVVFDRNGQLLRRLGTDVKPAPGPVASWRKYGHQ